MTKIKIKEKETKKEVKFTDDVEKAMEKVCYVTLALIFFICNNTWIGDSGTLCHLTNNDAGLYDIISINE